MLKEQLQGGQDVDGEAVLKAAFPRISIAGREAMPGTVTGAEPAGEGDLAFQPTSRTEPEENGEGVSSGMISPTLGLHAGEIKSEAVQKGALLRGSSGSVPASAAGREAMTDTVTGGQAPRKASPLAWLHKGLKPLEPPAGITFTAPFLIGTRKPSSHRKGPPTGKIRDTVNKKTTEPPIATRQMLKEMLQGKQYGVARKVPPFDWQYQVLKPSVPPAGVSARRTSPASMLGTSHKPSSHLRGAPTEMTKHSTDKKSPRPLEVMRQMLKEMLQGKQDVDGEAVLKVAFPGVSIAGREAMPGTVTGDWDRDMDYLEDLLEYGLKFLEDAGAEPAGEGDLAFQPTSRTEPEENGVSSGTISPTPGLHAGGPPMGKIQDSADKKSLEPAEVTRQILKEMLQGKQGVSAGNTVPPPLLIAPGKPSSHRRAMTKNTAEKKSPRPFEVMRQMLKEMLQGKQDVDAEAVLKAAFPRISIAGREAMPGTVTGGSAKWLESGREAAQSSPGPSAALAMSIHI
ncbi:uncharacterized protein LOC117002584 [Catharus ustulatus]|uniref:uncharacterized protein LOC117002584 n=1 Tax=Catharus ustulatus TaxID=91951 RepID=UPI001408E37D|nr:uncharacterized protein LOC117002584 [Catharus ustulatus]